MLAHLITVVEPAANEGGKKRSSLSAYEPSTEKKPMTSFAARRSSSTAKKLVIDLASPKGGRRSLSLSMRNLMLQR